MNEDKWKAQEKVIQSAKDIVKKKGKTSEHSWFCDEYRKETSKKRECYKPSTIARE